MSGEQQRAADPGALVEEARALVETCQPHMRARDFLLDFGNRERWDSVHLALSDDVPGLAAMVARLADALEAAHSRAESLHDRLGASLWDCDAARAENAALRPYVQHKPDCELGKELKRDGRIRIFVDSGGPLPKIDSTTYVYVNWAPPCTCGLAALAPPEPRHAE